MTEPGTYFGKVQGGAATKSKHKQSPQIEVVLELTHIAQGDQWQPLLKALERRMYLSLTDNAWPYTEKKLDALGFNGDFANPQFGVGEGIQVICAHETYQGQPRERWELANWGGSTEGEPIEDDTARLLNARWRQTHGFSEQPASPKAAVPATPPTPTPPAEMGEGPPSEGIPF